MTGLILVAVAAASAGRLALAVIADAVRPSPCFVSHYVLARLLRDGIDLVRSYDDPWFAEQVSRVTPGITDINVNPPTSALLLLPVASLGYREARIAWTLFSVLLLAVTAAVVIREAGLHDAWRWVFVIVLLLFQPLAANFHMANAYVLLLALATLAWHGYRHGRDGALGIALGLMLAIKVAGAFLWLLLIVERRWRALAWASGTAAAVALGSLPWIGWAAWRADAAALAGVAGRPERAVTAYQTVLGIFRHLLTADPTWNPAPVLVEPRLATALVILVSLALVVALVLATRRMPGNDRLFAAYLAAGVVLSPLSLDYTYTLMLVPVAVALVEARELHSWWAWGLFATAVVAIGADLPYRSPHLASGAWALLAYPKLYGAGMLLALLLAAPRPRNALPADA
ncbi:MAG: glycosyltransferase family 87 protein [Acidobacteriota bacterium]